MKSCIYQIENVRNGKRYIGSSQDVPVRWNSHKSQLRRGVHHNAKLQRAWIKHGEDDFVFSRLIYCDVPNLIFYEELLIKGLKPEYNLAPVAGTTRGVRYSEESRKRISAAMIGNKRSCGRATSEAQMARMIGNKMGLGRKHSEEFKAEMSARHKGNKNALGYRHSKETKEAASIRMKAIWAQRKQAGDNSWRRKSEKE